MAPLFLRERKRARARARARERERRGGGGAFFSQRACVCVCVCVRTGVRPVLLLLPLGCAVWRCGGHSLAHARAHTHTHLRPPAPPRHPSLVGKNRRAARTLTDPTQRAATRSATASSLNLKGGGRGLNVVLNRKAWSLFPVWGEDGRGVGEEGGEWGKREGEGEETGEKGKGCVWGGGGGVPT